jgi:hypothetical protein
MGISPTGDALILKLASSMNQEVFKRFGDRLLDEEEVKQLNDRLYPQTGIG